MGDLMAQSMVDNVADQEQVERAVRVDKHRDKTFRNALAVIANTPEGELLFEEISERAMFFHSSFNRDAAQMAFDEGRRSFGLSLLDDWLKARPDAFVTLLQRRAAKDTLEGKGER